MTNWSHKIRFKFLRSYLLLSLNLVALAIASFFLFENTEKLRQAQNKVHEISTNSQRLINKDYQILNKESNKGIFYTSGQNPHLLARNDLFLKIKSELNDLRINLNAYNLEDKELVFEAESNLDQYNKSFHDFLNKMITRGYKDHGLEGQMRQYAHELENEQDLNQELLLTLRRHEKDFIIRKELGYVTKFNATCDLASESIPHQNMIDKDKLLRYCSLFNEIVSIETEIGLTDNDGIRKILQIQTAKTEEILATLNRDIQAYTHQKIEEAKFILIGVICVSLVISIWMSILSSNQLSLPIKKLASDMHNFFIQNEPPVPTHFLTTHTQEVDDLNLAFLKMAEDIHQQFQLIENKNVQLEYQNDQLNKVNKELDQFIYSASHDLKAPLSSLLGLVLLSKSEKDHFMLQEYFERMEYSIQKLERHIKDIIYYAKNHQTEVHNEKVDLQKFIADILEQLKYQKLAAGVSLKINVLQTRSLYSDPMRLNMILFNLISNAFKYQDDAKLEKYIQISAIVHPASAQIIITDNGIGIEPQYQEQVFGLFFRASEKSTGSGLGLYIAKEAVEKLGGKIEITSELKEGTSFILTIPNCPELDNPQEKSSSYPSAHYAA
jgi:signal transduction histidine kinase